MNNPVTPTSNPSADKYLGSHRSDGRWRTGVVVSVAAMMGIVAVVALGAGPLGGGAASATPTHHRTTTHHTASSTGGSSGSSSTGGSDLFVVDGTSGSAVRTGTNGWRLSLTGATVLWFEDRPARGSGMLTAQSLASTWSAKFAASPPYGAVLAPSGPPGHHPTAIKLTSPSFNPATGVLSFTVTPDAGESTADAAWLSKLTPSAARTNGRVVLFIDDSSSTGSGSGEPAADDEQLVEYFNQLEFSGDIYVNISGLTNSGQESNSFALTLSCPPDVSPTIPGPDFDLTMTNSDNSASTTCANQQPLIFNKAQLAADQYPSCEDISCNFVITFSNRSTGTIYSETEVQVTLTGGNNTFIPDLQPATPPLRPTNFNPCLLSGTCALPNSKEGSLSLSSGQ